MIECRGQIRADRARADRGRHRPTLSASPLVGNAAYFQEAERERALLGLWTGLVRLGHPQARELDVARDPRHSQGAAEGEVTLDRARDRRFRTRRGRNERLDVLALDAHLGSHGRLEQRLGTVQRDDPVRQLDREIARSHDESPFEAELGPLAGHRDVQVLDAIGRLGGSLPVRHVGDEALVDLHPRDDRRRGAAGRAAARTTGPRCRLRFGRGREARHVQASLGVLDEGDPRPLERDVAELHAASQERTELEVEPSGFEREERRGAELRVFGDLELVQLDRRQREQRDRERLELDGSPDSLRRAPGDHRLDTRGVDETRQCDRRDDRQHDDHRDEDAEPLQGALHRAPLAVATRSGLLTAARGSGRPGA